MNNISMKLTLTALIVSLSLSGCSTNTRDQNTAVGAGTGAVAGGLLGSLATGAGRGWVIAGGAILGALIGGKVGHSMDSKDSASMNHAMDNNAMNEPSNWTNSNSGRWYKVVPTSGVMAYKGSSYCRHYEAYSKVDGHVTKTRGIACRAQDGKWYQVRQ